MSEIRARRRQRSSRRIERVQLQFATPRRHHTRVAFLRPRELIDLKLVLLLPSNLHSLHIHDRNQIVAVTDDDVIPARGPRDVDQLPVQLHRIRTLTRSYIPYFQRFIRAHTREPISTLSRRVKLQLFHSTLVSFELFRPALRARSVFHVVHSQSAPFIPAREFPSIRGPIQRLNFLRVSTQFRRALFFPDGKARVAVSRRSKFSSAVAIAITHRVGFVQREFHRRVLPRIGHPHPFEGEIGLVKLKHVRGRIVRVVVRRIGGFHRASNTGEFLFIVVAIEFF